MASTRRRGGLPTPTRTTPTTNDRRAPNRRAAAPCEKVPGVDAVAVPLEHTQRNQGIAEVGNGTRMQSQAIADLAPDQWAVFQRAEEVQLRRREQDLRL